VISDKSVDTLSNGSRSALTGSLREVPETDRAGNDELGGSDNESVEPEETEQVVDYFSLEGHVVREGDDGWASTGFLSASTDQV